MSSELFHMYGHYLTLIKDYIPIPMKRYMEEVVNAFEKEKDSLFLLLNNHNKVFLGEIVFYKGIVIPHIPYPKLLHNVQESTKLTYDCSLELTHEQFDKLFKENEVFDRNDLEQFVNHHLNDEQAINNLFWLRFANYDKSLIKEFRGVKKELIGKELKILQIPSEPSIMGVYLPEDEDVPAMRPWYLSGDLLKDGSGTNATARFDLNSMVILIGTKKQNKEERKIKTAIELYL